jgi:hypothetical protein
MNAIAFLRSLGRDNRARRERRRNLAMDLGLYLGNRLLQPLDSLAARWYSSHERPVVFIVGAPRSGTTLAYQLAVRHLPLAYVDNVTARFWMAPTLGALLPLGRWSATDRSSIALDSVLGSSPGLRGPHEFSYFWQHWLGEHPTDELTPDELERADWAGIDRKLRAIAGVFRAPLVVKSINFVDYHVGWLADRQPRYRFAWMDREPLYAVQSILESRRLRYGSESTWWSVRPRDVELWRDASPMEQVCHQVSHVRRALEAAFESLPETRRLVLRYADLVADPRSGLERLARLAGVEPPEAALSALPALENRDRWRRSEDERRMAMRLLEASP